MLSLIAGGAVKAARAVGNRIPHSLITEASAARSVPLVGVQSSGIGVAQRAFQSPAPSALQFAASIAAPLRQSPAQLSGLVSTGRCNVHLLGRPLSTSSVNKSAADARGRERAAQGAESGGGGELQGTSDPFDSITDKIPQRPVTVTEAGSYSLVIVAGLAVALAAAWAVLKELFFEPAEQTVFNLALDKCQLDPRVTVRLGSPVTGYGVDARSRTARHHIRHREFQDGAGVTHLQVQFQLRGPNGVATAHADAVKEGGGWVLQTVYVDVGSPIPQRLVLMAPEAAQQAWFGQGGSGGGSAFQH